VERARADSTAAPAPPAAQRIATPANELLTLQRTAGNRIVGALLARQAVTTAKPLRQGHTGSEVSALQSRLNQLSEVATALAVDGIFGPITAKAVKEFKAKHPDLAGGSSVDDATQAAISAALLEDQDQTVLGRKMFALGAAAYDRRKFGHAYRRLQARAASWPTARRCCSPARRRCAGSAAAARRRSRSTRPIS
jgi:peptidoglycan hydrolase-like protein with peptidoglycan-binding domain